MTKVEVDLYHVEKNSCMKFQDNTSKDNKIEILAKGNNSCKSQTQQKVKFETVLCQDEFILFQISR